MNSQCHHLILRSLSLAFGTVFLCTPPSVLALESWDTEDKRFTVLRGAFKGEAVRDNETGLVWEKSPDPTALTVEQAGNACINKRVGNRKGWRLPTGDELGTLIDPTQNSPALPNGHPFENIQLDTYWGELKPGSDHRFVVNMTDGGAGPHIIGFRPVWCVRGP